MDDVMLAPPGPEDIRSARCAAGLTLSQAAAMCNLGSHARWAEYENGTRAPKPATWTLFLLLTGLHPTAKIVKLSK